MPPGRGKYDACRTALGIAFHDRSQDVAPLIRAEIIGDRMSVEAQSSLRARQLARE